MMKFPERASHSLEQRECQLWRARVEPNSGHYWCDWTGGGYLSAFLLEKGYRVFGPFRRSSSRSFERSEFLGILNDVELIPLDVLDESAFFALPTTAPDEIYVEADMHRVKHEIRYGRHQNKITSTNFVTPHRE